MQNILILNGPNLNMLGQREPEIYGKETLKDIETLCKDQAKSLKLHVDFRQTNDEGQLIDWVQKAGAEAAGLIINPGAYGHTSIALMDAVLGIHIPAIEVHLSNIHKREDFRHHTYLSHAVYGVICGFRSHSYTLALQAMNELFKKTADA
jgi:3-dehydroquinate dehydratase II